VGRLKVWPLSRRDASRWARTKPPHLESQSREPVPSSRPPDGWCAPAGGLPVAAARTRGACPSKPPDYGRARRRRRVRAASRSSNCAFKRSVVT
jgi:hypothetical protein